MRRHGAIEFPTIRKELLILMNDGSRVVSISSGLTMLLAAYQFARVEVSGAGA